MSLMLRYVEGHQCRMSALVRHFGDEVDGRRPCGNCDFCAPENSVARSFHPASGDEKKTALDIVKALKKSYAKSTGKLYKDAILHDEITRDEFEKLLASMATAGILTLENAEFEAEGRNIPYRKATLTQYGEELQPGEPLELLIDRIDAERTDPTVKKSRKLPATTKAAKSEKKTAEEQPAIALSPEDEALEQRLRTWRLAEAKKNNVPAFCVLGNKTMRAIAIQRPRTISDLLHVPGIGNAKAEKFGEEICRICESV
jgi:superfamily II DNA helicase RecQ